MRSLITYIFSNIITYILCTYIDQHFGYIGLWDHIILEVTFTESIIMTHENIKI